MRSIICVSLAIAVIISPTRTVADDATHPTWGLAVGAPQILAITLEGDMGSRFRIQGNAGTLLLLSSAGIRALLVSRGRGTKPYAYAGGGILNIAEGEGGGAQGTTGFGWFGVGIRFPLGSWQAFAELGALGGLNQSLGYEPWLPSIAIGVAFGGH